MNGYLAEVDTGTGVARLNTVTGKGEEVESGVGEVRLAGCEGDHSGVRAIAWKARTRTIAWKKINKEVKVRTLKFLTKNMKVLNIIHRAGRPSKFFFCCNRFC